MKRKYLPQAPRLVAVSVATALGLSAPPVLLAQQAPPATAAVDAAAGLQEVVVTGSRIARRDYTATSPIVTVDSESLERSSTVGIESTLNELPQFQPGATQFDAARNIQSNAFGGVGAATVNLRGLGTNRTNDLLSLRAGVDNLLDKQPVVVGANPPATNNAASTLADYYDILGRRFYLGVKLKF